VTCYHTLDAWRVPGMRKLSFNPNNPLNGEHVKVPCGQCIGCRLARSAEWGVRCLHEAMMHGMINNMFLTLTFDDEHMPHDRSLDIRVFQLFMKRLRKRFDGVRIRFYAGGEYSPPNSFDPRKGLRPHWHVLIFGLRFPDLKEFKKGAGDSWLYTSKILEELWPFGFSLIGSVSFESAAYVARYCMKKIGGDAAESHYRRIDLDTGEVWQVKPECALMSTHPGIGADYVSKYGRQAFPSDYIVVLGKKGARKMPVPRYYARLYEQINWLLVQDVKDKRIEKALVHADDQTPERLAVREQVVKARSKFFGVDSGRKG
jgi:hypothetical protein